MSKTLFATALSLGLLALASEPIFAQGASTPADRTIRQGDTIEWVAESAGPHEVRFGAPGTTPVAAINTILESFTPVLTPGAIGNSPRLPSGRLLTAKVKNAATPGTTFIFTCGVHPPQMLSQPFTIAARVAGQPPRTHRIKGVSGLHWLLEVTRNVQVDTAP